MKKLALRTEHLGELKYEDLRQIRGAGAQNTVSDGSCVCNLSIHVPAAIFGSCDISDGSCACNCND